MNTGMLYRTIGKVALLATCGGVLLGGAVARAADVTFERLLHPEPQNWLMNHRDFGSHRYSPLTIINKSNVKNLKLVFALPLGGSSGNEYTEATPLVEDGFMYITDVWSVVYKIDVRSGTAGQVVWKMDPGVQKPDRNRGVALWGNLIISVAGLDGRVIATDKETGKIVWDKNLHDQPDMEITAAPLALDGTVIIGGSGGDNGVRCWLAALDSKTGEVKWKTFAVPAPGEPGSEILEGQGQRLADRRRRILRHRLLRSRHQCHLLGFWQSSASLRFGLPAGRQPVHRQHDRLRRRHRQDEMVFSVHAERHPRL